MIIFPWLIALFALAAIVFVVLATPGWLRSARRRGEMPFKWPPVVTVLLATVLLLVLLVGGYVLAGLVD